MGCVSENGCLGPKKRARDVYADLLDQIHQQAQRIQFNNNLNIYDVIHEKLVKKGYIRKLMDNLTSHRSKINECLAHNLRLTTQSKRIQNKYAGLIVLNAIVNNLFQQKRDYETIMTEDKTNVKTTSSQNRNLIDQQTLRRTSVATDLRVETHFFWLILHLLENQGRMYLKALESICSFCAGRRQKLNCRAQIWRVLDLILHRLQRGSHLEESARAYLALIEQSKDNGQEDNDQEQIVRAFLKLWMKKKSTGQDYQGAEMNLQAKYERIIKVLVRRSISSSTPLTIHRALLTSYEQQKFSGPKALAFQNLLFKVIQENDMHSSIIRGVFLYMLQYLSVTLSNQINPRVSGTDEFNIARYSKIMDKNIRLKAFQTLRRWGQNGYLHLESYVSFSASTLVRAFAVNLNIQREYTQDIMRQYLKLSEHFKPEFNLVLVSLLLQEIKWQNADQNLRQTLIILVRQVIQKRHLLDQPPKDGFMFFVTVDSSFSRDARLQLLQLMGFIAKHIPPNHYSVKENGESQFMRNLCEFLYSVYEGMFTSGGLPRPAKRPEDDQILFKYQFANSVISFLKCLTERGASPFVLAYASALSSSIIDNATDDKLSLYFLFYVLYEALHLLNSKQKIPDKMAALNFRMAPSLKANQIRPQIDKVVDHLIGLRGQRADKFVANINVILAQLKDFIMVSEEQYKQANNLFADYFKNPKLKGSFNLDSSRNNFKRRESILSARESSMGDRSRIQEDSSFKDVLEKIHDI